MSNHEVRRLLWHRYRGILWTAIAVLLITGFKAASEVMAANDVAIKATTRAFTSGGYTANIGGTTMLIVNFIVVLILGWLTFMWDNYTNFNHYLFSLRATRQQLFTQKLVIFGCTIVGSFVAMHVIFLGTLRLLIHHSASFNLSWGPELRYTLSQLMFLLALYAIVATIGLWLGQAVASALFTIIAIPSLIFTLEGAFNLFSYAIGVNPYNTSYLASLDQSTWAGLGWFSGVSLLIIGFLWVMDNWAFKHLSLENAGNFMLFPRFRMAFLWLTVVYLAVAVGFSSFGRTVYAVVIDNYAGEMPFSISLALAVIIGYLTWSVGRVILYRPDHAVDAFKFKKLA